MSLRTLSPDAALLPGSAEHPAGCPACGGAFLLLDVHRGAPCPLCGTQGLRPEPALAVAAPEALVPFRVAREDLPRALGAFVRGAWFPVADLDLGRLVERAVPVWLPAWWVDATGTGPFELEVAFRYLVRSNVDRFVGGKWVSEPVEEERLRWEPRVGTLERRVDNVEVDARSDLDWFREHLGAWERDAPAPADPASVDRATVVLPDLPVEEAAAAALAAVYARLGADVRVAAGGVDARSFHLAHEPADLHWTWLLLPAWSTWYADDAGVRHVVWVHGQTGRAAGPRMSASWKWLGCAGVLGGTAVALAVVGVLLAVLFVWFPPVALVGLVLLVVALVVGLFAVWPLVEAWGHGRRQLALARPLTSRGSGARN